MKVFILKSSPNSIPFNYIIYEHVDKFSTIIVLIFYDLKNIPWKFTIFSTTLKTYNL